MCFHFRLASNADCNITQWSPVCLAIIYAKGSCMSLCYTVKYVHYFAFCYRKFLWVQNLLLDELEVEPIQSKFISHFCLDLEKPKCREKKEKKRKKRSILNFKNYTLNEKWDVSMIKSKNYLSDWKPKTICSEQFNWSYETDSYSWFE